MWWRRDQELYSGLKTAFEVCYGHFAEKWPMKGRTWPIINFNIAQHTETDYEDKEPSRCQEDRGKIHHSSSKPRKDFSGKLAIRKIQITVQEPSESEESPDEQHSQAEEGSEEETYEAHIFKAGLSFEKEHVHCFKCEKAGHFTGDCLENKEGAAKKNLNNKGVPKKGDWKPQDKAAGGKKE